MPMLAFNVDPAASKLVLRTRAEGLLSRLAHDLELVSRDVCGTASVDGEVWNATLDVAASSIHVAGVLRGDRADASVLSGSDRAEIERRIHADVVGPRRVTVAANGRSRSAGDAVLTLGSTTARSPITQQAKELPSGGFSVSGRFSVRLSALGIKPIKGPLGAFHVKDTVEILYDLTLTPA